MVARDAYFWAWPLVNIYNRRLAFKDSRPNSMLCRPGAGRAAQPVRHAHRLHRRPRSASSPVPNQDVVYGAGSLALDLSPVVVQVPDFGDRFWVYQMVDLRTDSFVQLGKMYGTTPGFYLLVGPDWRGDVPEGHHQGVPLLDQHRLRRAARLPWTTRPRTSRRSSACCRRS